MKNKNKLPSERIEELAREIRSKNRPGYSVCLEPTDTDWFLALLDYLDEQYLLQVKKKK